MITKGKKKQVDSMKAYQNIRFFSIDRAVLDTGGAVKTRLSPRNYFLFSWALFVGKSGQNGLGPFEKSWIRIRF